MVKHISLQLAKALKITLMSLSLPLLLNSNSWSLNVKHLEIERPIKLLMDNNTENDKEAIKELKQIPNAADILIQELTNSDPGVRQGAIRALRELEIKEQKVVLLLIDILQKDPNNDVRNSAVISLGKIGKAAEKSVPALIKALKNDNYQPIRLNAISSLEQVAPTKPDTTLALIDALQDKDPVVRSFATTNLGEVLWKDGSVDSPDVLHNALKNVKAALNKQNDWQVRLGAAQALGSSGRDVKFAIGTLEEALQNSDYEVRRNAIKALREIAKSLSEKATSLSPEERVKAKEGLQQAIKVLEEPKYDLKNLGENIEEVKKSLNNSLQVIKNIQDELSINRLNKWIWDNPKISIPAALVVFWLCFVLTLLGIRPLFLLRINDVLQRYTDLPLPDFLGGIQVSTLRRFLFGSHYHPRVLDAWVKSNLEQAHKEFQKKQTVRERNIYIPVPVVLDGENIAELTAKHLQPRFTEKRECLLIWGEGGSGKTSLACQVAKWAMSNDSAQRLCKHRMLPILVEQELDFKVSEGKQAFTELISGLLRDLIDAPETISEELIEQLLRKQRLLIIVDHFSEMSKDTRSQIRPELPSFPVNALVVTSRLEERLGGVNKTILKPMRVEGNRLSSFMEAYLTKLGKRDLFDDQEFFEACSRLSALASQRDLTVLLVKLYADQMIAAKAGATEDETRGDLPDNIPDLMLDYIKQLNCSIADNPLTTDTVQQDAKIVAWECLRQTYRPATAKRDVMIAALGGEDAKTHLEYLENRLRITQTVGPSENQIRFSLDPLAEYLAGLYLVENYADNEQLWRNFLGQAEDQQGIPKTIQGFLLAVRDCCFVKGREREFKVPDFVFEKLDKLAGLDSSKSGITNE